jgi:hypothetical protein
MRAALALFILAACGGASAQVRQCMAADGSLLYTDKPCETLGATELPPATDLPGGLSRYRSACVRDLPQFMSELSDAIELNDVNRLAALYRWQGTSSRTAFGLMRRLEDIAARPLLQVVPIYPGSPGDAGPTPPPPARQVPAGVRLDQTLANGITPAATTLWLRRDLGCWWVTL